MKQRKYKEVKSLPTGSKTVSQYSKDNDWTPTYTYKLASLGKIKMRVFMGINFVLPTTKK